MRLQTSEKDIQCQVTLNEGHAAKKTDIAMKAGWIPTLNPIWTRNFTVLLLFLLSPSPYLHLVSKNLLLFNFILKTLKVQY